MLIAGSLLALLCGLANATAAAMEKREGMRSGRQHDGLRLLAALARRPLWLLALVLSALAWVAEASSLALAPVPAVATLRTAGRGLLVVAGWRWLGERFSRLELTGVVMASAGGALTAVGTANAQVVRRPLSNLSEVLVAVTCVLAAASVSRSGRCPSIRRRAGRERVVVGIEAASDSSVGTVRSLTRASTSRASLPKGRASSIRNGDAARSAD